VCALRALLCAACSCALRTARSAARAVVPVLPHRLLTHARVLWHSLRQGIEAPCEPPWTDATPPPLPPREAGRLGGGGAGLQPRTLTPLFATNADAAPPPPPLPQQPDRQTSLGSLVDVPLSPLVPPRPFGGPPGEQARSRRARPF
jgi:hypothetical protein